MEDYEIVELYWQRDEQAVHQTDIRYRSYLLKIASNILGNPQDEEEVLNDTYLKAWNSMPEHRPKVLSGYLGKIARELSIDCYRRRKSAKRYSSEGVVSLNELEECIPDGKTAEEYTDFKLLVTALDNFLGQQKKNMRDVFLCRYFYMDSVSEIAGYTGFGEAKVKSMLFRMRKNLRVYLEKEGFAL